MKHNTFLKAVSIGSISIWLAFFALVPCVLVLAMSFLQSDPQKIFRLHFTFSNYIELFDWTYVKILVRSLSIAGITTFICLSLGYPFAYSLARLNHKIKPILLLLVIIPFWTSSLIRTYAMIALLKTQGIINYYLLKLHFIDSPLQLLYTNSAVIIGLTYNLLPFMILPLYANIERLDMRLLEAARDLGATKLTTFQKIIIPLTWPGIIAGCILVFLPAMTLFYIPAILGGSKSILLGNLIQQQFLTEQNWPLGSATNVILTAIMVLLLLIYWRSRQTMQGQDVV